jgi:RNA polymerase sigma-70 factor, ECF subfamily
VYSVLIQDGLSGADSQLQLLVWRPSYRIAQIALNFLAAGRSFILKESMDPLEQALQQTLVVRCQVGDRKAVEELFLRYNRALGYYLRRMLDQTDVADVQQEVWLTVIRRITQLRNPEAFVVWLYQIARNQAAKRLSARHSAAPLEEGDDVEKSAGDIEPEFSPIDAAQIHEELAHLSATHREVLLLRFMENLSYEQIAEVINCHVGTVRSRLHYAKLALRQRLENQS